ncbi:hypothetical protein FJT64_015596 [Amphibalanus amphitrite]|uniref:Uncharacterized protein n=1 Tax=Amphibalanus amphitrite TaxID=1232801 RepID=A0A6A4X3M0_AMPAM|nr:hypothetical protein FJT64_015596 [Amphibalanus amphitrite]
MPREMWFLDRLAAMGTTSSVTSISAVAGGSASNGGISQNSAQASNLQSSGLFGQLSHSNTGAVSNQFSGSAYQQPTYYH